MFAKRTIGLTPVNKTYGTKIASEALKGRVFETSLVDLSADQKNVQDAWRKVKLICEEVQGRSCITNFHSFDITQDKLWGMIKKWQDLIETFIDCKTVDGYLLRVFVICFTTKGKNQVKATSYASSSKVKLIRAKINELAKARIEKLSLKEVVGLVMKSTIEGEIQEICNKIFPLQNMLIRKIKTIKSPKFDASKIAELYGDKIDTQDMLKVGGTDEPQNELTKELTKEAENAKEKEEKKA
jgi:small subunit ribosomal protein S3Ae